MIATALFSAFILLVLIRTDSTDTANTAALSAETEAEAAPGQAAVYRRRSRRVREVCHRHGLAGGQPANSRYRGDSESLRGVNETS